MLRISTRATVCLAKCESGFTMDVSAEILGVFNSETPQFEKEELQQLFHGIARETVEAEYVSVGSRRLQGAFLAVLAEAARNGLAAFLNERSVPCVAVDNLVACYSNIKADMARNEFTNAPQLFFVRRYLCTEFTSAGLSS
jgi:hypothetical protein